MGVDGGKRCKGGGGGREEGEMKDGRREEARREREKGREYEGENRRPRRIELCLMRRQWEAAVRNVT